ncbi:hypothetical protein SORBI_3001G397850 [Sorghum bicolor]|uniref:DUF7731 domain-containing protein n=1 Tax=Sorghum bicolor TaxID=4558 RepID=A0A1Z5SAF7_SORBI|nr:hypothetical protein SORBI_3001G397850 [Sorghum bicolor]
MISQWIHCRTCCRSTRSSLQCFEDDQVYSCCEATYRLNPSGIIAVPIGAVDYYCAAVRACVRGGDGGRAQLRRQCPGRLRLLQRASMEDGTSMIWSRIWATTLTSIYGDDERSFGSKGRCTSSGVGLLAFLGGAGLFLLGP